MKFRRPLSEKEGYLRVEHRTGIAGKTDVKGISIAYLKKLCLMNGFYLTY